MAKQMGRSEVSRARRRDAKFFKLAKQFRAANAPLEVKRLGGRLGRLVFGN